MENSLSATDSYWRYIESAGLNLSSNTLALIAASLENTFWEEPTSAIDLNNFAVVALTEAEQCEDLSLKELYFATAFDALKAGVELQEHPLCSAHLALLLVLTGEIGQATQSAFADFINILSSAYVNEQKIIPGIVYLPLISKSLADNNLEPLNEILKSEDGFRQSLLLLSEILCRSQLIFYNSLGLRFLHLVLQFIPNSATVQLKLGIAKIVNNELEGLVYLYRAKQLAPDYAPIIQSLYLAYRDLGQKELANLWMNVGRDRHQQNPNSLDWQWTELDADSRLTYVPFDKQLILAVEPTFGSIVTRVLLGERDWFEKEMEFWRNAIKSGMTVIDVGANVGVYTFSAALRVGATGRVLAVEPFSGCIRCLEETCKINQINWVKICAGAASDSNGIARLGLSTAHELNEIIDSNLEGETQSGNFETVSCFTLDSLIESENIAQVDFLKIDAEGHEIKVLEGSQRILTEFAPTILYENIAGSKGSNLAVADFLKTKSYQLFRYQPYLQRLIPISSSEDFEGLLNVIAVPNWQASPLIADI